MNNKSLDHQAMVFSHYLIKQSPSRDIRQIYIRSIEKSGPVIGNREQKILGFAIRQLWAMGLIDAGLALVHPESELRRRIYIMFAILEATPEYCDKFLPKKRNFLYPVFIVYSGIRGVIKGIVGILLISLVSI